MYTGESQIASRDYDRSNGLQELISEAKAETSDLLLLLIFSFVYWFVETPASKEYFELFPEEM